MNQQISHSIIESIELKQTILNTPRLLDNLCLAINKIIDCYRMDGKVLFCGNGGSAADAQHMAAELSGRFNYDRPALQAEALHVNSSFVTAVGNDYGFEYVFARMLEAWGKQGDVLVAISTSGNSPNIIKAIEAAIKKQMWVIGLTGQSGGLMNDMCHVLLNIPSQNTPRIQEAHILLGHILCEHVEKELFPR
jgi:D-sedoheptulose 7-phosphate isomerase